MSNTLQYLDYEGLKYYDYKLREKLSSLIPEDGKDGLTPVFRIQDNELQYRYTTEENDDTAWRTLGNVKGADGATGADGADGTSVTIESTEEVKDESDNVIGIKVTFSDGKEITINHGKDGADGADGEDGDVLNMQLGQEIKTNVVCGALGIGQTLGANLTLADIVKKLTTKVYEPSTKEPPKATLTMTDQSTKVEIGTTLTPTLTPSFTDGKFNSYAAGATTPSEMNAGCSVTDYKISRSSIVGEEENTTDIFDSAKVEGGFTKLSSHNDSNSYKIGEETIQYTTEISHTASTVSPTNSNGEKVTTVKYSNGSKTAKTSTISSALYNFHVKGDVTKSKNDNNDIVITRSSLVAGNLVFVNSKNEANIDYGKYTSAGPNGTLNLLGDKSYFFVPAEVKTSCPNGYKYKLLADDTTYYPQNNSKNAITGWYKLGQQDSNEKWSDLVVKIPDANGTLRDYHVYKFKSDTPYTDAAFLRFSCVSNTKSEASGQVEYQNSSDFFA